MNQSQLLNPSLSQALSRRAAKYPEITLTFKPKEAVRGMADAVTGVQQVGLERAEGRAAFAPHA